ncbi:hypothetical protein Pla52o_51290 [Novipirellula galeiformis]|uniref:Uncharacterized protein n=1 Tax=Novipirellula galeiformis TaxID=2528004 RepID=A0A5C6BZ60_9BACT|nr:hypothetical protein Pla52o_51290 [Novipirellula galeiformis]
MTAWETRMAGASPRGGSSSTTTDLPPLPANARWPKGVGVRFEAMLVEVRGFENLTSAVKMRARLNPKSTIIVTLARKCLDVIVDDRCDSKLIPM